MIYPYVYDERESLFADCEQCVRATSTVMHANLLLFKTVIAGDSWGLIAVPVIENNPATAIIFMGSLLTLVFGVLNLIVAVIVDTFAEARQRDVLNLAEEMEDNVAADQKFLESIFQRIDADGSGQVTFEELLEGARRDPQFQSRLRVMDIDEADLQQLFEMIDVHGEGEIAPSEFIAPLTRWVHDSKTAPRFIKYNVLRSLHQQEELYALSKNCFDVLSKQIEDLAADMEKLHDAPRSPVFEAASLLRGMSDSMMTEEMECTDYSSMPVSPAAPDIEIDVDELEAVDSVEQPHASKKFTLQHENEQALKAAIENLERYVLTATEQALKKSMGAIEKALHDSDVRPAAAKSPPHPHVRPARALRSSRVPKLEGFETNIFERRRRASLVGRQASITSSKQLPDSRLRSLDSDELPTTLMAISPGRSRELGSAGRSRELGPFSGLRQNRLPVGKFQSPGAGLPAPAMPEEWRTAVTASIDLHALRERQAPAGQMRRQSSS